MRSLTLRASLVAAAAAAAGAASAAIAFTPVGGLNTNQGSFSLGYAFSINQPGAYLTALGYYDQGGDGLATSHDVGLYTSTGTLIASASVAAGTSSALLGQFRYSTALSGQVLLAPGSYVLAATTGTVDNYLYQSSSLNPSSGVTYVQNRFVASTTLAFPTQVDPNGANGFFGGNFTYEVQAVPEPSAFAALGLGVVALVRRRRKG